MKIGIVGLGHVGKPLYNALKYYHEKVFGYDKNKSKSVDSWYDILRCDITFICVPTDSNDGRLDCSIVEKILSNFEQRNYKGTVAIKSTLRVGFIDEVIEKYTFPIVVFPEWLRERFAFRDVLNPEIVVVGVRKEHRDEIVKVFDACCWIDKSKVFICEPQEAVMVKLVANALASTKISFANQVQLICDEHDIDANIVMEAIRCDPRCSPRYLIPGRAYGGYCLPKDTKELLFCSNHGLLFKAVEEINKIYKNKLLTGEKYE